MSYEESLAPLSAYREKAIQAVKSMQRLKGELLCFPVFLSFLVVLQRRYN